MKKALPIVIVVVVLGVGAFFFLSRGKGDVTLPGTIEKKEGETGETFTGKLKEMVARGVPLKCTFSNDYMTGTGWIKGKKYYGEIKQLQNNQEAFIIMVDNCMWTWSNDQPQGIKMCSEPVEGEEDLWDQGEGQSSAAGEYSCSPAVFSDDKFTPPGNIQFLDMQQMQPQFETTE